VARSEINRAIKAKATSNRGKKYATTWSKGFHILYGLGIIKLTGERFVGGSYEGRFSYRWWNPLTLLFIPIATVLVLSAVILYDTFQVPLAIVALPGDAHPRVACDSDKTTVETEKNR
jgi:hypothetical protein